MTATPVHNVGVSSLRSERTVTTDWIIAACMAAPFTIAAFSAASEGWFPVGDNAKMLVGVHDVIDGAFPLLGQVTSGGRFGTTAFQLGPAVYYVNAPSVWTFGPRVGLLIAAAAISASAVAALYWAELQMTSRRRALWVLVSVGVGLASLGGVGYFYDPLHSIVATLPTLAYLALLRAWAHGHSRAAPACVAAGSFAAQAHIQFAGLVITTAVAMLVLYRFRRSLPEHTRAPSRRPMRVAALVAVVMWSGPLVHAVTQRGAGVLDLIHASSAAGERVGIGHAARILFESLLLIPPTTRTAATGWSFTAANFTVASLAIVLLTAMLYRRRGWTDVDRWMTLSTIGAALVVVSAIPSAEGFARIRLLSAAVSAMFAWLVVTSRSALAVKEPTASRVVFPSVAYAATVVLVMAPLPLNGSSEYEPWTYAAVESLTPDVVKAIQSTDAGSAALKPVGPRSMLLVSLGIAAGLELSGMTTDVERPPGFRTVHRMTPQRDLIVVPSFVETSSNWKLVASFESGRTQSERDQADAALRRFAVGAGATPSTTLIDATAEIACLARPCRAGAPTSATRSLDHVPSWILAAAYLEQFDENLSTSLLVTPAPPPELLALVRSAYETWPVSVYLNTV